MVAFTCSHTLTGDEGRVREAARMRQPNDDDILAYTDTRMRAYLPVRLCYGCSTSLSRQQPLSPSLSIELYSLSRAPSLLPLLVVFSGD